MDKRKIRWLKMYELAKKYYNKYGDLEVPALFKTDDGVINNPNGKYYLGTWIQNQRKKCDPKSEKGMLLSQIGMRFDARKRVVFDWEEMFLIAVAYYCSHNDLEVPTNYRTDDGIIKTVDGKYNLGEWIQKQRQTCDPISERGKLLSKIGMRFEKRKRVNVSWENMYEEAKKFFIEKGHLKVPISYVTEDGYKLGVWIKTQGSNCNPMSERGKLLSQIGMSFGKKVSSEDIWMEKYRLAKIFYEKYGHLEIPGYFITDDGFTYNKDGKVKLGMWLAKQRERCNPDNERGQLLLSIGMRFETNGKNEIPFEHGIKLLEAYISKYKNSKIPYDFKTKDGINLDKNGICLGRWLYNQLRRYSSDSTRGQLLISMGFDVNYNSSVNDFNTEKNSYEISWLKMFKSAAKFYNEFGHIEVPRSKRKLFEWLFNQKEFYRNGILSNDKIIMLESIGIVWNPRLEEVCANLGIDYGKNIEVLRHMTYNDFKLRLAFIDYLNKKGYDVVNDGSEVNIINYDINFVDPDGNLHEIFSMSIFELERKFGNTFSEFNEKYEKNKQKRISF